MSIHSVDLKLINFFRRISVPAACFGLFVVFFWFGALKVAGTSPAAPLVQNLFERTIGFMSFDLFMITFGLFECLIGILFIIRGAERIVIPLLFLHMVMTFMPLFVLPEAVWSGYLTPTLEGQYIIKNLTIIAAAIVVAANLHPMSSHESR